MEKTCLQCSAGFDVSDEDLVFYENISPVFNGKKELVPPPTLCPDCRLQRRMGWRNDRTLHHRKCDKTGKQIISIYSADKPYVVYDRETWLGDGWDALDHGRAFDFSKTFAEQFDALTRAVPHASLFQTNSENCDYANHVLNCKNCFLIAGGGNDLDCMYGRYVVGSTNAVECGSVYGCERCYETVASEGCYGCLFARYARNCNDCFMIEECQGCKNCLCCFGLRNKEYCILNEQFTKEEYEKRMEELRPFTRETIRVLEERLEELKRGLPNSHAHLYSCEDCTGDMVVRSKNTKWAFDVADSEDSKFVAFTPKSVSTYDATFTAPDGVELCCEVGSSVGVKYCFATYLVWYGHDVLYSTECHHCDHCFGCVGLRNKSYCVFNKQYTKEEYEELVPKIIARMRETGEWGEYLPLSIARFGYNESVASDYVPLTREEALSRGWKWHDEANAEKNYLGPVYGIPKTIAETRDDIVKEILLCEATGKPFKMIPQELAFYRDMGLPPPRRSPDQRFRDRIGKRNPRTLWKRRCAKCSKDIETSYAPDRPETVYCEECYLSLVY